MFATSSFQYFLSSSFHLGRGNEGGLLPRQWANKSSPPLQLKEPKGRRSRRRADEAWQIGVKGRLESSLGFQQPLI